MVKADLINAIIEEGIRSYVMKAIVITISNAAVLPLPRPGRRSEQYGHTKPSCNKRQHILPIPQQEVFANPNMSQNAGY